VALPQFTPAGAQALAHTFASARRQPPVRWLRALGAPASAALDAVQWRTLSTRSATDWTRVKGVSADRARRLAQFFTQPVVRAQLERLRTAGVQGF